MLCALLRVTVASLLFGMTNAGYGQGPAFAHGMAAQGQAMGVQGRAFGHQRAAQAQAMVACVGRGARIEDIQERVLEQR